MLVIDLAMKISGLDTILGLSPNNGHTHGNLVKFSSEQWHSCSRWHHHCCRGSHWRRRVFSYVHPPTSSLCAVLQRHHRNHLHRHHQHDCRGKWPLALSSTTNKDVFTTAMRPLKTCDTSKYSLWRDETTPNPFGSRPKNEGHRPITRMISVIKTQCVTHQRILPTK